MKLLAVLFTLVFLSASPAEADGLTVRAQTGIYTGLINPDYSGVREFRNIPYGQAPVGKRRWAAPVAVPASRQRILSYRYPPSCPQYMPGVLSLWNTNYSDFMINTYGQNKTAAALGQSTSEDCLSLAIWTPRDVKDDAKLPVAFFMTGGSFQIGGVDVPNQIPAGWVNRTQQHIAVTINYRVNIFGFPNAAGLDDQNLGIMDQRLALEWVYANIAAFGGDPERITQWGQSAGGVSTDVHSYAYHDDPLAAGYYMESGTAFAGFSRKDPTHSNFTFVAQNVGCNFPDDPASELDCMRQVPLAQIMNWVGQYTDNGTNPAVRFQPWPDEKLVFSNYTDRGLKGLVAKVPALYSTCSNEDAALIVFPYSNITQGPNKTVVEEVNVSLFACMVSNATQVRSFNNLTTYRSQYAGNFSSISMYPWMGAAHSSDLPMIMGTFADKDGVTDFQTQVAQTMEDYLFAFIVDPENGLQDKGWLPKNTPPAQDGTLWRWAAGGVVAQNASTMDLDGPCLYNQPYNPTPQ